MTTSTSVQEVKWKLKPKLEEHLYFLWPTPLRSVCTQKIGWLYLAHPYLTLQSEIATTLAPLIHQHNGKNIEIQAIPAPEMIEINNQRVHQRVLALRGPHDEADTLRDFLTAAFSDKTTLNIGYLTRYTFVPSHQIGSCTKTHLQTLLKLQ